MSTSTPHAGTNYRVLSGVGAGAGAALVMLVVMGVLRFGFGVPSVPELMLGPLLRLLGGEAFSAALDKLYYAGRPLLFAVILEGTLLLGALLGLLYAWLRRPKQADMRSGALPPLPRPLGGLLYGLMIGLLLNTVFMAILGEDIFPVLAQEVYSAGTVPLWVGLLILGLVFGLSLDLLLPAPLYTPAPTPSTSYGERSPFDTSPLTPVTLDGRDMPAQPARREFLRIGGGAALALVGGLAFWYGGTVLNQGSADGPVNSNDVDGEPDTGGNIQSSDLAPNTPVPSPAPASDVVAGNSVPQPTSPSATPTPPPTPAPPQATEQVPTLPPESPIVTVAPPTETPPPTALPSATPTPLIAALPINIPLRDTVTNDAFYHVSKNFFDPSPSSNGWQLNIRGMVDKRYSLNYAQLTALTPVTVAVGMMCISNPVGGGLIGSTVWRGVRLADLIARAKPRRGVVDLRLTAIDGYTDSIPYAKALDPNVILAWEMGGVPLPTSHGFPARLLVPGIYGMKHVKWLNGIELVNSDYKGYWQQPSQGWSDAAVVNTMCRIDTPAAGGISLKKQLIAGIAFAGDRSISKVEVSTDAGATWNPAFIKPPLSTTSWVLWGFEWTPPQAGKYSVKVRATDGRGNLQSPQFTNAYPNGATGYHAVSYTVRK